MASPQKELTGKSKQITVSNKSEEERLRKKLYRSDMEKFLSFTQMLRTNALYKQAKVTHK
jgi:hypothetical protein